MPVYFIQGGNDGPIKIGRATMPERRLHSLQTGSPVKLHLLGVIYVYSPADRHLEDGLHERLNKYRLHGEWFRPEDEVLFVIREVRQKYEKEIPEVAMEAQFLGAPHVPVVVAHNAENGGLKIWCKYCDQWHFHGQGEGHRLAHCIGKTPYSTTGYVLRRPYGSR